MILNLLSYPRSILMTLIYPVFLLITSGIGVVLNLLFNSRHIDNRVIKTWCRLTCWMFGVEVAVKGEENLKTQAGCLLLFNHTSFFDIFALHSYVSNLRFGAKIELFSIPIFGVAMRRTGVLPIARTKIEEVIKVYQDAEVRVRNGEKFALAPEGTRQDRETLGPFKSGPFIFAINSKAPVVPVIIRGASEVLDNHSLVPNLGRWKRTIRVEFLPAVDSTSYTIEQRGDLQRRVFDLMKVHFLHS